MYVKMDLIGSPALDSQDHSQINIFKYLKIW